MRDIGQVLRQVEDAEDAAAELAVEKEAEAEQAEFTRGAPADLPAGSGS